LSDDAEIELFLRNDRCLHVYELGDLDDFFRPDTTWFGRRNSSGDLTDVVMMYSRGPLPVVLALSSAPLDGLREILPALGGALPKRFYAHLTPGLADVFSGAYSRQSFGTHLKMARIRGQGKPSPGNTDSGHGVCRLTRADEPAIQELYRLSYPGNWFSPDILATGKYFGQWEDGRLVGIAGVHLYSPSLQVAAVGNVTTHPDYRGRGIARRVCAALCADLEKTVEVIGLNVKNDNVAAIRCYQGLGFDAVAEYEEWLLVKN
jgi:ribosomal protein S18 acetylase RimI-like enzyme